MFTEPIWGKTESGNKTRGWIEVITGCMFSGKTEELIRRVNRAIIANQNVLLIKPSIDTRYHPTNVVSHNQNSLESIAVNSASEIIPLIEEIEVVGIDEIQFFDKGIVTVCNELAQKGKRVIVAGLNMDSDGRPFASVHDVIAIAEFVTKLHAICSKCGNIASYTYRTATSSQQILVGEKESYEARCRECFYNVEL